MLVVPEKVGRHEVLIARGPLARKLQAAGQQRRSSDRSRSGPELTCCNPHHLRPSRMDTLGIEQHPCAYRQGRVVKITPPRAGAGRRKRRLHKGSAEGKLRKKVSSWQLTQGCLGKVETIDKRMEDHLRCTARNLPRLFEDRDLDQTSPFTCHESCTF